MMTTTAVLVCNHPKYYNPTAWTRADSFKVTNQGLMSNQAEATREIKRQYLLAPATYSTVLPVPYMAQGEYTWGPHHDEEG